MMLIKNINTKLTDYGPPVFYYAVTFVNDLCSRLDAGALEHSSEDVGESWTVFRDTVYSSAMDSLGPVSRKNQDWFDENDKEIQVLLEEKHQKHKAYLRNTSSLSSKTAYSNICKTVQTRLRDMARRGSTIGFHLLWQTVELAMSTRLCLLLCFI